MKNWFAQNWYKIVVAALLLIALGDLEYGYYQFLRWAVAGASAFSAFVAYENGRKVWMWVFVTITVLFNPIAPIYLEKETWRILDLISALVFVVGSFSKKLRRDREMSGPN